MKITDIKQQVKRAGRYSIFVNGKYSFSLSELTLINSGLRIRQEVTEAELEEYKDTAKLDKAFNQAIGILARRARSEWELKDYLKRKGYDEEVIIEILNRLSKYNYVNDMAFAKAWVENRRLLKPISRRRLVQELKQKRIAEDVIEEVLEADSTNEIDVLKELIERKQKQSRYQDPLKLMQYLIRQGYQYGDVKTALAETDT